MEEGDAGVPPQEARKELSTNACAEGERRIA